MAFLIHSICFLLQKISNVGGLYGNLRIENIIITLDQTKSIIKHVRFLGFECISTIEDAETMNIPDQIDHMPPDLINYFIQLQRFN